MASEFELIDRHFRSLAEGNGVVLGVGDDTAILDCTPGHQLLVTVDTMVEGVHFLPDVPAVDLGYKSLAVNLSDIAAMGGVPRWATLALTLPGRDDVWLAAYAQGLREACREHEVALVGGDTTRGPLTISIQLLGEVPAGEALRRDGARSGDSIYVTGTLGDAALGLACVQGRQVLDAGARHHVLERLQRPRPRVALGGDLRGMASAAIDVSDGLLADLGHVLEASGVGAAIELEQLPLSTVLRDELDVGNVDWNLPLSGGDDYELLFTASPGHDEALQALAIEHQCPISCIGRVTGDATLRIFDSRGEPWVPAIRGYDHFGADQS